MRSPFLQHELATMLRVESGISNPYCDGLSRRSFVQLGMAGMAGGAIPELLRAKTLTAATGAHKNSGKQTSIIMIWIDGGLSHLDTYDMKPEAPEECRGIWKPIKTNVPGIDVTEMFPLQAKQADKFTLIRSIHHDRGDHFTGGHIMLTGREAGVSGFDNRGKFPSIGSIATKFTGSRQPGMPPYIAVPYAASIGLVPGYHGGNFLGSEFDPYAPGGDPNADNYSVTTFDPPSGLTIDRLESRQEVLKSFDQFNRRMDRSKLLETSDQFQQEAYDLVTSARVKSAFHIGEEDVKLRERYGRGGWGQSTLLARRLVEAGATFVTVHFGGWDNHWDLQPAYEGSLPRVDAAVASLLQDLSDRSLLEQVLVLVVSEFGRTPVMNNGHNGKGTPGRDHWGRAFSCLAAGGGVQGGRIVGATNSRGERPAELPLKPDDLHATMYHVLGIDPQLVYHDRTGRPIHAVQDGDVIQELF